MGSDRDAQGSAARTISFVTDPTFMHVPHHAHAPRRPDAPVIARAALAAGIVCIGLMVSGCFGKRYAEKTDEVVDVPDSYGDAPEVDGPELDRWCSDFEAPQLEQLVQRAFDDNLDLRSSWARLEQAAAGARRAGSARWPTLTAEGNANRRPQPSLPDNIDIDTTTLNASLAASYEADLWGKLANRHQAARLDRKAARAQVEAMAISLTSQIAETWLNLVHQRAKEALLKQQIDVSEQFLKSTAMRLGHGQASALDVNQQRQQVESLRGQLATIRGRIETAKHQLAVLVGKSPQTAVAASRDELPALPERPSAGVPADLLKRRPDIRAAMYQLEAADQRTAAAIKDQFPSIRLSASLFFQAPTLDELFEDLFWQATAAASQPLFDGGRRRAAVERAKSTAELRLYEYASTFLTALREVQDAMILETKQKTFVESLRKQRESAKQVYQLARQRYRRGAADYLRVLTALQSLQNAQQTLLDAKRQQFSYRLQLCRALGGTWTRDLEPPAEPGERPEPSSGAESSDQQSSNREESG